MKRDQFVVIYQQINTRTVHVAFKNDFFFRFSILQYELTIIYTKINKYVRYCYGDFKF